MYINGKRGCKKKKLLKWWLDVKVDVSEKDIKNYYSVSRGFIYVL